MRRFSIARNGRNIMKKLLGRLLILIAALAAAFAYYYVTLPAFNIHSTGTWMFLIVGWIVIVFLGSLRKIRFQKTGIEYESKKGFSFTKLGLGVLALMIVVLGIGTLLSSPIISLIS